MAAAATGPALQPDIAYTPNYESYSARVKRRQEAANLDTSLPPGFPSKLESDLVWDGKDLASKFDWSYRLTDHDINEINAAVKHFKSLNKPLGHVNPDTFPLPTLHATLRDISREIHLGRGFKVVQGLPVDNYTREENVMIYSGLASHVAPIRGRQDNTWQGKSCDVALAHIIDMSRNLGLSNVGSPAYTTEKQVFHTDTGDVITLFCLGEAISGGESYIASSWFVYNELARTRPDLIRTLAEPWEVDGFGRGGQKSVFRPLLYYQPAKDGQPERTMIQYARRYFTGYSGLPRSSDIGPITEAQAEALDTLHFLAEKHSVALEFHKGDIQFANNMSLFHARGAFVDSADQQRHLIRFWLRDPELAWETPEHLRPLWDKVYKDLDVDNTVFPLDPVMRDFDGVREKKE
ncbi:hypothetical protein FZEAL_10060 [Fusarium zealandicum]|uniref:TauD/TfdA-like domain-containing protein n=1 Tax=Fusarium zealandicum TaxID=1053134 RepID=A0A8H4XCR7_9HYPO|nr:hypothetical protein FZEAL_10060 [Fusarium zealandicum]